MTTKYQSTDSFRENGFIIIPNVLSKTEVEHTRALIGRKLTDISSETRMLFLSNMLEDPNLLELFTNLQFHPKVISILRSVLGTNFTYVNDFQL